MNTGLAGCSGGLVHNVIHSSCGYPEKMNEIRGLGGWRTSNVSMEYCGMHVAQSGMRQLGHAVLKPLRQFSSTA
jgi:hypothetical protein